MGLCIRSYPAPGRVPLGQQLADSLNVFDPRPFKRIGLEMTGEDGTLALYHAVIPLI
jgi:hypothetical protein